MQSPLLSLRASTRPDILPSHPDQVIRLQQLLEIFPLSRSSIHRLVRAGQFPAPISLGGGRAVGWIRSEIEQYLGGQVQKRDAQRAR